MIRLTADQLYKKIAADGIKNITWFEGFVTNPKEQRQCFHKFKAESVDEVLNDTRQMLEEFQGTLFTLMMYKSEKGTSEAATVVRVLSGAQPAMNGGPMQGVNHPAVSEEEMYQRVLERMHKDFEDRAKDEKIRSLTDQLNGLKTAGDKVAYVGTQMLTSILLQSKNPKIAHAMQGLMGEETTEAPTEVTPKNDDMNFTKEEEKKFSDPKKLSESIATCINFFGEENINKLAKTIIEQPDKAAGLKLFL